MEEYRLKMFLNRVLRKIYGHKKHEVTGEEYIMRNFITCTLCKILSG
jgi:hypothetical protein